MADIQISDVRAYAVVSVEYAPEYGDTGGFAFTFYPRGNDGFVFTPSVHKVRYGYLRFGFETSYGVTYFYVRAGNQAELLKINVGVIDFDFSSDGVYVLLFGRNALIEIGSYVFSVPLGNIAYTGTAIVHVQASGWKVILHDLSDALDAAYMEVSNRILRVLSSIRGDRPFVIAPIATGGFRIVTSIGETEVLIPAEDIVVMRPRTVGQRALATVIYGYRVDFFRSRSPTALGTMMSRVSTNGLQAYYADMMESFRGSPSVEMDVTDIRVEVGDRIQVSANVDGLMYTIEESVTVVGVRGRIARNTCTVSVKGLSLRGSMSPAGIITRDETFTEAPLALTDTYTWEGKTPPLQWGPVSDPKKQARWNLAKWG